MEIKKSELFIPVGRIPVLSAQDTISDALDAMKEKGTRLVIVKDNGTGRALWLDELLRYCLEEAPLSPWLTHLAKVISALTATVGVGSGDASAKTNDQPVNQRATLIIEKGEVTGVASEDRQALVPPAFSECVQGHVFAPPIPKKCPYDGTLVM